MLYEVITDLKITEDDVLYAGTHGRGMWMSSAIVTSVEDAARSKPLMFALGQNYPNPVAADAGTAAGSAVVPFTLEAAGVITSYSIHYTKLYEAAESAPLRCGIPDTDRIRERRSELRG